LESAFVLFDSDGDGYLNADEVGHVLRLRGYVPTNKEVDDLVSAHQSASNKVSLKDIERIMVSAPRPSANIRNELTEAFRVFDREENGYISENDLRIIFTTLGESVLLDEINALLSQLSADERGRIRYETFVEMICAACARVR